MVVNCMENKKGMLEGEAVNAAEIELLRYDTPTPGCRESYSLFSVLNFKS